MKKVVFLLFRLFRRFCAALLTGCGERPKNKRGRRVSKGKCYDKVKEVDISAIFREATVAHRSLSQDNSETES